MLRVERAETTEAGIDDPQIVIAVPSKLVDVDVAGDMNAGRQIAAVVLARRLELFRHRRHIAIFPDGVGAADSQPSVVGGDAHRFGEGSEVSVQRAVIVSNNDCLTRLIGGNDEAYSES